MSYLSYNVEGAVSDGIVISAEMSAAYERGYISVLFYSDAFITSVIPSAGTLTCELSETGERYGDISNGIIDATVEAYNRPAFIGAIKKAKITALGITGALNYRVTIHRFTNGR